MTAFSTTTLGTRRRPGRDLVGIAETPIGEIDELLRSAASFSRWGEGRERDTPLLGFTVVNLFNEPSTRTRLSFEHAASRLGAHVVNFAGDGSSSRSKGETIRDELCTVDAMGVDAMVIRDGLDRLPHDARQWVRARIVNAGDGRGEHPTQALLDALTIVEAFDRPIEGAQTLEGIRIAICGDIDNGRVAHSGILLLRALGAEVRVAGPQELLSDETGRQFEVPVARTLDDAVADVHVVMMLRIQRERLAADIADLDRYHAQWGLTEARLGRAHPRAIVMHPGPMNRGVEIADDVADGIRSRILRQVTLGVATRMAVLCRACGVTLD